MIILGTWWRGGTAAQRNKFGKVVVVDYEKHHHFPSGQKKEGVLLSCPVYDMSDDSEREFWYEVRGKKGYVALKEEYETRRKEHEFKEAARRLVAQHTSRATEGDDDLG